jgi:hypothetical protein
VVNGEYYVDYDPERTIGHYGSTRRIDTAALRRRYEKALGADARALASASPLAPGAGRIDLPRYFAERYAPPADQDLEGQVRGTLAALNEAGYWPAPLPQNSHPYTGPGSRTVAAGDFATTHVGDESDTSPWNDATNTMVISTQEYLRNMNILVRSLAKEGKRYRQEDATSGEQH